MEIHATMIVPASKVAEARAIAGGFTTGLSASGPATHYVSSGLVSADIAEAVKPLCSVYAEDADGLQVIADAGLALCDTSD
jgi:hypothetical protein